MNDRLDVRYRDVEWLAWNRSFDPAQQLALCASQLETLRSTLRSKWPLLDKPRVRKAGLAEAKFLVKHLIRVASESVDFYATVDFITNDACDRLEDMRRASGDRSLIGHLKNWDKLTHEHMVPGTVVLHALCGLKQDEQVLPMLRALSFRALISGTKRKSAGRSATDAHLLDVEYGLKSKLPSALPVRLRNQGLHDWNQVPFRFWPLMRYGAAGLLPALIPVTERARTLLYAYEAALLD